MTRWSTTCRRRSATRPPPIRPFCSRVHSRRQSRARRSPSSSPPIVFAVVDFDGGGRMPIELTDAKVDDLAIGGRVEMTFRRLFTADGIHNYFWKARPVLRSTNG